MLASTKQTSDLPDESEPGVQWFSDVFSWERNGSVISRAEAVAILPGLKQLPLPNCTNRCSESGICLKRDGQVPTCQCVLGRTGESCSENVYRHDLEARYCPHGCNGNGICEGNWCHCKPGWFGRDCSRPHVSPHATALPSSDSFRIYIYELPWQVASLVDRTGWSGNDPNYLADEKFLELLSGDWGVRTENPHEANLFLVPLMTYQYSDNLGQRFVPRIFRHVMRYLQENSPFWQRHGGRDHIMWSTADRGACHVNGPLAPIIITHWGQHVPQALSQAPPTPLPGNPLYVCHPLSFDPAKDIVVPGYYPPFARVAARIYTPGGPLGPGDELVEEYRLEDETDDVGRKAEGGRRKAAHVGGEEAAHVGGGQAAHVGGGHAAHVGGGMPGSHAGLSGVGDVGGEGPRGRFRIPRRDYLREAFFAGNVPGEDPLYSGGVRQELWRLYGDGEDPDIVVVDGYVTNQEEMMRSSRFCITPSGHGWGVRLLSALALNCVPLLVQDGVYQPFEELLPYEHFSLRLQRSDLPRLRDILKAVTPEEHLSMRRALARVHLSFGWDPPGTAYNATLAALRRRYNRIKGLLLPPSGKAGQGAA